MTTRLKSPEIEALSWGEIRVTGAAGVYKDAKLFPGGSRPWDWKETGTYHNPGIQPADVAELLENGAQVVILGQGYRGELGVTAETLELLSEGGTEVHVLQTEAAVKLYNQLRSDQAVGALIHSTC